MTGSIAQSADIRSAAGVHRLHPSQITDPAIIRELIERAQRERAPLTRGMNRQIEPEIALIEVVERQTLTLRTVNFEQDSRDIIFLNLVLCNEPYFFQARVLRRLPKSRVETHIPESIYRRERRSRERRISDHRSPTVSLEYQDRIVRDLAVVDSSPEGIAIDIPAEFAESIVKEREISLFQGKSEGTQHAVVRNSRPGPVPGWRRLGLELGPAPSADLRCESLRDVSPDTGARRLGQSLRIALGGAQVAFDRALRRFGYDRALPEPQVVDIQDEAGHRIRALIDSWGPVAGATAVVIPPGWGRTKETLMPLAATIIECFRHSRRPISVLRFDGINKRGESFRDPDCIASGREHHRFTFYQGVRDIRTVVDYLDANPAGRPGCRVLVSFSASSIEARRAVADDPRIDGWVCVVGSADLQSMMRAISGGIDYALGIERGVKFGLQEILGVAVDMDLAGADALAHELAYLADARREMARIRVPITWISGRYDAWMDAGRVRDAMSRGDTSRRKLIEIPTGHMLKTSRQALGVFQLIAREVAEMSGGFTVHAATPNLAQLERKRLAERGRLSPPEVDLRQFWGNYLLGKDRTIGFDLMMLTSAYKAFMLRQIDALRLKDGDTVIDLGSGTGGFPFYLCERPSHKEVRVVQIDFVRAALQRARSRVGMGLRLEFVEANVDGGEHCPGLPLASSSVDAVLASLLLSYLGDARAALQEIRRVLRPGGRVVLSSLRRDADMSKLFVEGAAELKERWTAEVAEWAGGMQFEDAIRGYMNEASRLLDLEEQGRFAFWDPLELGTLLRAESFADVRIDECFGQPPQAVIASGSTRQLD